jgi:hypothetical protein
MDKFYQPNSGLRSSRSLDEAIYRYNMIQLYIHVKFSSTREIIAENEHVPLGMIGVSSGTVRHLGKFQCRAPVLRRDGSSNVLQTRFMLGLEDVD